MASQVHIGSFELTRFAEASAEPDAGLRKSARRRAETPEDLRRMAAESKDEGLTRELLAQGVEFVARPGEPYVDSWLRTRRFMTLLSTPEPFAVGTPASEGQTLIANRVACH